MIRVGIVDFDTSHVVEFTKRLNHKDIEEDQWVYGAEVVAGYPGVSNVTPADIIEERTRLLRDKYGVKIVDAPEDLLGKVDAVFVESQEGEVHFERAKPFIEAGLPIFIDKPFASSVSSAKKIFHYAEKYNSCVFSSSSLRYALEVQELISSLNETGNVVGVDAYSPASLHPRNPGLYHYGIHGVEVLFAIMGTGCDSVWCVYDKDAEVVVGKWKDGRIGSVRGTRKGAHSYGFTAFCEKKVVSKIINTKYIYRELLKRVVEMFKTRKPPLDPSETMEIIGFIEGALKSALNQGMRVEINL